MDRGSENWSRCVSELEELVGSDEAEKANDAEELRVGSDLAVSGVVVDRSSSCIRHPELASSD